MKFKNTSADYQSSVTTGKKMGFAPEAESFLMDMMSDGLYSDKYGSIVRELASNALDANAEVGLTEEPVCIDIVKPNSFTNQGELVISDSGTGINPQRINDIFTLYFASTKRDDNEMIGGFGIGAKSPFAYTNLFRVETWCDGTKYTYLMEKRGQDRTCTLLNTVEEEGNGTKIRIPIKDAYDYGKFVNAVNDQCMLMRPLSVTISDGVYEHMEVVEFENFYVARDPRNNRLLANLVALGSVVYEMDAREYVEELRYGSNFTLIPKLEIGKVMPTMSRESLQLTDDTVVYLKTRYADAVEELQSMIDDAVIETDVILDAFKADSNKYFTLPGTDIELDIRFGDYSATVVKKEKTKFKGFTGNRDTLRAYIQGVCTTTAQFTKKYSGNGNTWRNANKSDSGRYHSWVLQNNSRTWGDENPLFIRWKPEDKLTPADKEYMEEKFSKTDYTSMHLIQRTSFADFNTTFYSPLVGGLRNGDSKEDTAQRVFEKYGRQILLELMDKTQSFEDWRATPEYIEERKQRLKDARKQVTKKDRAKDQFRLRGIGRFGVADTTLENLQRSIGNGILYLNSVQLESLKEEHKNSNCSWQSFDDWVHENYEHNNVRLFVVSAKTYKLFQELGVFATFESAKAKREEREVSNDATRFYSALTQLRGDNLDNMLDVVSAADPAFKRYLTHVTKVEKIARNKMGATNTGVPFEQTEFKIGQDTVSLEPIKKLRKVYLDMQEERPFLADAISGIRTWDGNFHKKCIEALKYVYPGRA